MIKNNRSLEKTINSTMPIKSSITLLVIVVHHLHAMELALPFSILITHPAYIDKTSFLREFFKPKDANLIITAPPGFGKTSALEMIELFANIELNDDLDVKPYQNTTSWKILQKKTIGQDLDFVRDHLSQYIVIKLDLRVDLPMNLTRVSIADLLLDLIISQVEKYSTRLKNSTRYCKTYDQKNGDFLHLLFTKNIDVVRARAALFEISTVLFNCFNRQVIILVDNYDHVAKKYLFKDVNLKITEFYEEVNSLIHHANRATTDLHDIFKIIIASTTAKPLEWVDEAHRRYFISNFKFCRFLKSNPFLELVGFTETEVDRLITQFHLKPDEKQVLLTYYNAYLTYPEGKKIYCPTSVINFIKVYRKSVQSKEVLTIQYKESFERISFLTEHLNNASRLELQLFSCIANQSIAVAIDNFIVSGQIMFNSSNIQEIPLRTTEHAWSYLFETGFVIRVSDTFTSSPSLKVANHEAQRILHKLLIDHHNESRIPLNELGKCTEYFVHKSVILTKESIDSLFGLVEKLLERCINNTDSSLIPKDNELKYQAILYAASLQLMLNDSSFVVNTMQYRNKVMPNETHFNETYYGVYYYNSIEKNCAIVVLKNSEKDDKEKQVFLDQVAGSYSLPHADVKHLFYAVVYVFEDGHLESYFTTYKRYYE